MRKKLYVVMHKSDSVQFLFRQRGSLFMASREFCGGLMACLFLVVFRLAVKIFGNVMAISAKIRLGGYWLWLEVYAWSIFFKCVTERHSNTANDASYH